MRNAILPYTNHTNFAPAHPLVYLPTKVQRLCVCLPAHKNTRATSSNGVLAGAKPNRTLETRQAEQVVLPSAPGTIME